MKKLLISLASVIGALGVTAIASAAVIACNPNNDVNTDENYEFDNQTYYLDSNGVEQHTDSTQQATDAKVLLHIGYDETGKAHRAPTSIIEVRVSSISPEIKSLDETFRDCKNLTAADLSGWNTSNVTQMSRMFQGCETLETLNVSTWNTDNVEDMYKMFANCNELKELNLSNWNTSKVTDMSIMFWSCESLTTVGDLTKWDTSLVTNMNNMFYSCKELKELNLTSWNTSLVTDMSWMFFDCESLSDLKLGDNWKTSEVTNIRSMFANCYSLALDCSEWDVTRVTAEDSHIEFNMNASDVTPPKWKTSNT